MNIVITGASRGIGFDTVLELSKNKENNILALSRNIDGLQELCDQCVKANGHTNVGFLPFDLSNPDFPALSAKLEDLGGVDILINNAGLLINKKFEELTDTDWERSFNVNFFGALKLTRQVLPYLKAADQAHVINILSMGGFQGSAKFPGLSAYSASKAALGILTECLAEELKEEGVAVNGLAFGAVQTEMLEEAFPGLKAPVSSQQMGAFMAYFASQGYQFFNGKILPVSVSTP